MQKDQFLVYNEIESHKIRYFLVDCRPAEQLVDIFKEFFLQTFFVCRYNEGHLLTAFHLDATLMLREKNEFDEALKSLFAAQEQAIQAGSTAAGEHLCFIGKLIFLIQNYYFQINFSIFYNYIFIIYYYDIFIIWLLYKKILEY